MAEKEKKRNKLRDIYRLIIYNDNTFEEVWQFRLSRLNMIALLGSFAILFVVIITLTIAFTPLREFIPGYPDGNMQRNILNTAIRLDSLEREIQIRGQYISNIKRLIEGKEPEEFEHYHDTNTNVEEVSFTRSKSDSLLRERIRSEQFNLSIGQEASQPGTNLANIHFFTPLKGIITNPFNPERHHYGVDIVASPDEVVKAILEGTVTMATWTLETGYILQVQHDNNLISVYKHNADLMKETGSRVDAGDVIAIVGNSGELTTGPHLHFELWYKGNPLDPEKYINF